MTTSKATTLSIDSREDLSVSVGDFCAIIMHNVSSYFSRQSGFAVMQITNDCVINLTKLSRFVPSIFQNLPVIPIMAVVATNFNQLKYLDENDVGINMDLFGVFMAYTPKDYFTENQKQKFINEFTLICPMGTGTCVKVAHWGTSGEILKKSLETVRNKNPGMDILVGLKHVHSNPPFKQETRFAMNLYSSAYYTLIPGTKLTTPTTTSLVISEPKPDGFTFETNIVAMFENSYSVVDEKNSTVLQQLRSPPKKLIAFSPTSPPQLHRQNPTPKESQESPQIIKDDHIHGVRDIAEECQTELSFTNDNVNEYLRLRKSLGANVSVVGPMAIRRKSFEKDYNDENKAGVIHFAKWIRKTYKSETPKFWEQRFVREGNNYVAMKEAPMSWADMADEEEEEENIEKIGIKELQEFIEASSIENDDDDGDILSKFLDEPVIIVDDAVKDIQTNEATNAHALGKNDDATNVIVQATPHPTRVRKLAQKGAQVKKRKKNDKK